MPIYQIRETLNDQNHTLMDTEKIFTTLIVQGYLMPILWLLKVENFLFSTLISYAHISN